MIKDCDGHIALLKLIFSPSTSVFIENLLQSLFKCAMIFVPLETPSASAIS